MHINGARLHIWPRCPAAAPPPAWHTHTHTLSYLFCIIQPGSAATFSVSWSQPVCVFSRKILLEVQKRLFQICRAANTSKAKQGLLEALELSTRTACRDSNLAFFPNQISCQFFFFFLVVFIWTSFLAWHKWRFLLWKSILRTSGY